MGIAYIRIVQITRQRSRVDLLLPIVQTGGAVGLEDGVSVLGGVSLEDGISIYTDATRLPAAIEVYTDTRKLYQNGNTLLRYLPAEYAVQDINDDLKQFLQVVAISYDEFYNFAEDLTTLFDPDRCPAKYLPYLARLINYPLNTRGFDSTVPSLLDAAVHRARRQLRTAVDVYKRKGLKEAFQILFYGLGYYIELVELWTKNYASFFDAVPAGESLYHPVGNPTGWFKSPYFGIKLVSLNQQTVCTDGGEGQPWSFTTDDLQEITDAIHSIRPVHTVLWWLDYHFDMCDSFQDWNDVPELSFVDWVPVESVEYQICDPDDPLYYRNDERLNGVVREWAPQTDPTKPGPTVAAAVLKREQLRGICHPGEWLTSELGEFNLTTEEYCTQVYRSAGQMYRDGFNPFPRDGSNPTRDPSAFGGRNGGYWKDTPLAPFYTGDFADSSDAPSSLVPDRSGCYMLDEQLFPLYQIAEEAEDGIVRYYNTFEFSNWLDTIVPGVGPDPDLVPGNPYAGTLRTLATAPLAVADNALIRIGDDIWSLFGSTNRILRLTFISGVLNSTTSLQPDASLPAYGGGSVALFDDRLYYLGGAFGGTMNTELLSYNYADNTVVRTTLATDRSDAASAQAGGKLYLFSGRNASGWQTGSLRRVDLASQTVDDMTILFSSRYPAAIAVNDFVYFLCGESGQLWRLNTVTGLFDQLATALFRTTSPVLFASQRSLFVLSATASNWVDGNDAETMLEYNLATATWSARHISKTNGATPICQLTRFAGRFYGVGAMTGITASAAVQLLDI